MSHVSNREIAAMSAEAREARLLPKAIPEMVLLTSFPLAMLPANLSFVIARSLICEVTNCKAIIYPLKVIWQVETKKSF